MTEYHEKKGQREKIIILVIFLFVGCLKLSSSLFDAGESGLIQLLRVIGLFFNCVMAYFAYRNNKLSTWIISIIMIITGVGTSIGSIRVFIKGDGLYFLHFLGLLFGLYFIYGGIKLIIINKERRGVRP